MCTARGRESGMCRCPQYPVRDRCTRLAGDPTRGWGSGVRCERPRAYSEPQADERQSGVEPSVTLGGVAPVCLCVHAVSLFGVTTTLPLYHHGRRHGR